MRKQILKFMLVICMFCGMLIVPQMDASAAEYNVSGFFKDAENATMNQKSTAYIYVESGYGNVTYSIDDTEIAEIETQYSTSIRLRGKKAGQTVLRAYTNYGEFELPVIVNSTFGFEHNKPANKKQVLFEKNIFSKKEYSK